MKSKDIRQSFIDFFVDRGHLHRPSGPLVPRGDATLLFSNAGMVQFKDYFLGKTVPDFRRAVTSQKCLRVSGKHNDLENVGPSPRHHTFFEMLGNFSFGDYFKEEAIEFAWQLVTEGWQIPSHRLFASVFEEDDEALGLWAKISDLPERRVVRCGAKDNFWAMGDTGPCGPCSEIFFDTTPEEPEIDFVSGSENGRYVEIWNLVFMQFERSESGVLEPLPKPSIDTGSGLERVCSALQGVPSNYDTDLFQPLIGECARIAGTEVRTREATVSLRVVADHIRAVAFLLADGVIPANEGRGYVLRRLLRRAARHGMKLGLEEPFLGRLLPTLGEVMGASYPELAETASASAETIRAEEDKYLSTMAQGAHRVQQEIEKAKSRGSQSIGGEVAFRLYDTHGLPLEALREIAEEEQMTVDVEGFEEEMNLQKSRSREASGKQRGSVARARAGLLETAEVTETEFTGYHDLSLDDQIVALVDSEGAPVEKLAAGEQGFFLAGRTPFYAESGGQVADQGSVAQASGRGRVVDVQGDAGLSIHRVEVTAGELETGAARFEVDRDSRLQAQRHHTGTHLLHAALREALGKGVRQMGSLVHPERLRFDFSHSSPLTESERDAIEENVNRWILRSVPVSTEILSYDEAVAGGAMALFGEKYGDVVRTVAVPGFSRELCGGCHVLNTGEIGPFVLTSERAVASGVRRIEALCGTMALEHVKSRQHQLEGIEEALGVSADRAREEIDALKERLRRRDKELAALRVKMLEGKREAEEEEVTELRGVKVLTREVPPAPSNELRNLADILRQRLGSGVVLLGARGDGRVNLVAAVTKDLTDQVDAGRLARTMGDAVGGSGGGRRDFAQAGGKDPGKLPAAFQAAKEAVDIQMGAAS